MLSFSQQQLVLDNSSGIAGMLPCAVLCAGERSSVHACMALLTNHLQDAAMHQQLA